MSLMFLVRWSFHSEEVFALAPIPSQSGKSVYYITKYSKVTGLSAAFIFQHGRVADKVILKSKLLLLSIAIAVFLPEQCCSRLFPVFSEAPCCHPDWNPHQSLSLLPDADYNCYYNSSLSAAVTSHAVVIDCWRTRRRTTNPQVVFAKLSRRPPRLWNEKMCQPGLRGSSFKLVLPGQHPLSHTHSSPAARDPLAMYVHVQEENIFKTRFSDKPLIWHGSVPVFGDHDVWSTRFNTACQV